MPKVCNKNEGEWGVGVKLVTIKRKNEFTSQLPFCSLGYIHQTVTHPVQYICKGESQVAKVSKSSKLIQSSVQRKRMQDIFEEIKMTSKYRKNAILEKSNVVSSGNVIYILNDQDQHMSSGQQDEVNNEVYQILSPQTAAAGDQEENFYQIIETTDETIVGDEEGGQEYTETITIVSEENDILGEEIIYVANDADDSGGGPVTFMQVSGLN